MRLLALIALFILVPLAELYVILKVGDAIGWSGRSSCWRRTR